MSGSLMWDRIKRLTVSQKLRLGANAVMRADGKDVRPGEMAKLAGLTASTDELNDMDVSARTQAITAAGAIDLDARYVDITGPESSTYEVTLAVPARPGIVKVIEMTDTTSTNAVTLALTNVVGGSQDVLATFDAAGETLVLVSAGDKWVVLAEVGVTLTGA